jgi:hypothetical protein
MGSQQLLFVILGVIIIGIAIIAGISMFSAQGVATNRDSIISDLNELGAHAYQFRGRLRTMGGGQGDYSTFTIPAILERNNDATYSIQNASPNSITFLAVSAANPSNTVIVTIDSDGKLADWTFSGDFQ